MSFTKFTKGPWSTHKTSQPGSYEVYWEVKGDYDIESGSSWGIVTLSPMLRAGGYSESENNAHLIAAAGTAATRAEEMGYDGRAAVEALPELIGALSSVNQLIAEAATTGFNCHDGDWAERLFFSQQATSDALTKSKGGRG